MATSKTKTIINSNIQQVWKTILDIDNYSTWRSNINNIKIINEKQFIEYTNGSCYTLFTTTNIEEYKRWEFDVDSRKVEGHWIGIFTSKGDKTEINFTEYVNAKKFYLQPFLKFYLKKQQKQFVKDLKKYLIQKNL